MTNTVSKTISDETLSRIIQIESAGNPDAQASTSTAGGLGQFIRLTWAGMIAKYRPDLAKQGADAVFAMRKGKGTAKLQIEMLARFTEENAALLGAGYTDGDLYLSHFLGVGTAKKFLRADPTVSAETLSGPAAVDANSSILRNKTAGQVRTWAASRMAASGKTNWIEKFYGLAPVNMPVPAPPVLPAKPEITLPPPGAPARDDLAPTFWGRVKKLFS